MGDLLKRRGIQTDGKCKRCGGDETILHILLTCPFAMKVWELSPALFKPNPSVVTSVTELFNSCQKMVNLPPSGISQLLFPWILWNLWTSRNQLVFQDKLFDENEVITKALKDGREWQLAQPPKPALIAQSPPIHQTDRLPTSTAIHVFSDGAWDKNTCRGGMGWIVKTSSGATLLSGSSHRRVVASAMVAEALAMKEAIGYAVYAGFKDLLCFTDCKSLSDYLTGNSSVTTVQGILHDIGVLTRSLDSISFFFIPRVKNEDADSLAKAALAVCFNFP